MEFNKETFEKALKANKIARYQSHFEAVVKSYLEIENAALRQPQVSGQVCNHPYEYLSFGEDCYCECEKCNTRLS